MYHGHDRQWNGEGRRLVGLDSRIMLDSSRYMSELEENLRKLLCPHWAVGVVKRAVRAKLALGWELEDAELETA
jgi:hypothetical protein